jgi:PadR family transcriptional regulator PadR
VLAIPGLLFAGNHRADPEKVGIVEAGTKTTIRELTNSFNDGIYHAMQDTLPTEIAAWRSQLRKGSLELAVLIALRKQPRYGLELVDLLNKVKLGISEGSIYPLLARLRAEKKVVAQWIDTGVGHSHKYYELTDLGRATLKAMWRDWREFGAAYDKLMEENGD